MNMAQAQAQAQAPAGNMMSSSSSTVTLLTLVVCSRLSWWVVLMSSGSLSHGSVTDHSHCLKSFKNPSSIEDPFDSLTHTWNLTDTTEGSVCNLAGECWHPAPGDNGTTNSKEEEAHNFPTGFGPQNNCSITSSTLPGEQIKSDFYCLKSFKSSIEDPLDSLTNTWNLTNTTEGSVCNFAGVDCWHSGENKVLNIKLPGMGLKGHFPLGLQYCTSLTGLDLSNNDFNGPLPSNMSKLIPYVTTLDLSSNNFSGDIPSSLDNCSFLNVLNLDHNQFSGQIPPTLAQLARIKTFNVANNRLSGSVPIFGHKYYNVSVSYDNNLGLCNGPLDPCRHPKKIQVGVIVGALAGALVFVVIVVVGIAYILPKKKQDDPSS